MACMQIESLCKMFFLQLEIIVYDTSYPTVRDTSTVLISVIRDEAGPVFTPSATYQVTIPETTDIGSSILDVNAFDQDGVSVKFYAY